MKMNRSNLQRIAATKSVRVLAQVVGSPQASSLAPGIMTRLFTIVVMSSLVFGCRSRSSLSSEDGHTLERRTILDEAMPQAQISAAEWAWADCDFPSDVWETLPKIGKFNQSRFEREMAVTQKVLDVVKPKLPKMRTPELLAALKVFPPHAYVGVRTVEYFIWRDGNEMILEELKRRPVSDWESLRSHTNDARSIFTGDGGSPLEIRDVVYESLGYKQW